jgi:hypothetical protein
MKIDFNNVRRQACISFSRLVNKLNSSIEEGQIIIDADDIEPYLDSLRNFLIIIAASYDEGNGDFVSVLDEVGDLAVLNTSNNEG